MALAPNGIRLVSPWLPVPVNQIELTRHFRGASNRLFRQSIAQFQHCYLKRGSRRSLAARKGFSHHGSQGAS